MPKAKRGEKRAMPQNFLDLHIVKTVFPLPQSELILSGGEPLLHPKFVEACNIVSKQK